MKRFVQTMAMNMGVAAMILTGLSGPAFSQDVCSQGTSEPPFLSFGVNSNLLMLLDNSGSMLDMAYINPSRQCFDDTFATCDPTDSNAVCYAGNFSLTLDDGPAAWYKWIERTPHWRNTSYTEGDVVYYDGAMFRAQNSATSIGATIYKDTAVTWEPLLRPGWKANRAYHADSFVFDLSRGIVLYTSTGGPGTTEASYRTDPRFNSPKGYQVFAYNTGNDYTEGKYVLGDDLKLYQAKSSGISCGTKVTNDRCIAWEEADYFGWAAGKSYIPGDIATTDGMLFECLTGHTADGDTIYDEDNFATKWQRRDEGYFEKVSAAEAQAFCKNAAGNNFFASADTCATTFKPAEAGKPTTVMAFAATGNYLNWATSSKFDIQKNILTGGKFNSDAQRIIGENRGCGGGSFIKQAPISQIISDTVTSPMFLTMKIRMGDRNDRVDSSDDTTRFEIYAITKDGLNFDPCEAAMEYFKDPLGVSQVESNTEKCVGFSGNLDAPDHTVYHKAMQACWHLSKQGSWKGGNDHLLVAGNCEDIYTGNTTSQEEIFPANISIEEAAYVCYGVYDGSSPSTNREGFIGRCWKPGDYTYDETDICRQVPCAYGDWDNNPATPACTNNNGSGLPCFFTGADNKVRRCGSDGYIDRCGGNFNTAQEKCNVTWEDIFYDSTQPGTLFTSNCVPTTIPEIGFWEADYGLAGGNDDGDIDKGTETTNWEYCVDQSLRKYCLGLEFPEVIDPSDQASSTEESWNLPSVLIDAAIVGQLGEQPMLVAKGYILHRQDQNTLPPQGILHETAIDLRIGAMAFNTTGADTECDNEQPPVNKHCPKDNMDGARVITPIKLGSILTNDLNSNGIYDPGEGRHVEDLAAAINRVRAVAWTPLAEAMYNAIGYYTQNTDMRLDYKDFQTDADIRDPWVNNKKYLKGTYLLDGATLYLSEDDGISKSLTGIAGDTGVKWTVVGKYKGEWTDGAPYDPGDIVQSPAGTPPNADPIQKFYITYIGGIATKKDEAPHGSPLYDLTVAWETLIDPVTKWCQDNHILIITEGASTADISEDIINFVNGTHIFNGKAIVDPDGAVDGQCIDGLQGSTYLDDLIYFGRNFEDPDNPNPNLEKPFLLYPPGNETLPTGDFPFTGKPKKSITTHVVMAGTSRNTTSTGECNPQTLMNSAAYNGGTTEPLPGEDPVKLKNSLLKIFNDLRQRASAGSAASVISSARGGEGAIYQAIFWPQLTRKNEQNKDVSIAWVGDVHGLFLDSKGFMYEDTNQDRALTADDRRVIIYFDENQGRSLACYDTSIFDSGTCTAEWTDDDNNTRTGLTSPAEMHEVKYLWSVNDWLKDNALITGENRTTFISNEKRRYIFTWNDSNDNGIVDATEILPFVEGTDWAGLGGGGRGTGDRDFGLANNMQVDRYINWLRGNDDFTNEDTNNNGLFDAGEDTNGNGMLDRPLRSRQIPDPDGSNNLITWRLGDIIHSTPMTVAAPAEGYHLIYNDYSYAQFLRRHKGRRHVVYFGANDGMLHAVNAGFYSEDDKKFCLYPLNAGGNCTETATSPPKSYADAPALGAELWAYVPYNLLPHLKCLADPDYAHKYYVDQRPRIFDVQIFEEEAECATSTRDPACIHPRGWGTILVGGMRFGGSPIDVGDERLFTSNYFILDITDPEKEPILLGEMTSRNDGSTVNLGYSTVIPTMAIMNYGDCSNTGFSNKTTCISNGATWTENSKWYLVLGSGPTAENGLADSDAIRGISDTTAKVSILPLDWLVEKGANVKQPLRIDPGVPTAGNDGGTFTLDSPNGFVSDLITVDYDINPSYEQYKSDVIYFGTVEGNFGNNPDGTTFWNGGGKLYRLITKEIQTGIVPSGADFDGAGSKYGRGTTEATTRPYQWVPNVLLDLTAATTRADGITQPITASASVGTDGHNFWVYFGTGRFFDAKDKTDDTQHSYYGIKEPAVMTVNNLIKTRMFTWEEVLFPYNDWAEYPGKKGLWKVDDIQVGLSRTMATSELTCRSGFDCLPPTIAPFLSNLNNFIGGTGLDTWNLTDGTKTGPLQADTTVAPPCTTNNCTDGWYRDFYPYGNRERNVGQATLLGGLVTFTTYQPFNDMCQAEGNAYLYGLYYRTGTGWHKNIFGTRGVDANNRSVEKLDLGRGLATTPNLHVGSGDPQAKGAKAFVQTSTGEIQEIEQDNLPISNYRTGRSNFRQCN